MDHPFLNQDGPSPAPAPKGTLGEQGVAALGKKQYGEAIKLLDKALGSSKSPSWLLARAQAHQNLRNYDQALRDVELAYHSAIERGGDKTRDLIIDAQYRRAVVLFGMGRYADADCCARWSQSLAALRPSSEDDGVPSDVDGNGFYTVTLADVKARATTEMPKDPRRTDPQAAYHPVDIPHIKNWHRAFLWRCQTLAKMETLPAGDPGRMVTVQHIPSKPEWVNVTEESPAIVPAATQPPKPSQKPAVLRSDFYQTADRVTVSLFAKGVDAKTLEVNFTENQIVIGPLPRDGAGSTSHSTLALDGYIVPEGCRYTVTPSKIELVLQKKTPGMKWAKWGEEHVGPQQSSSGQSPQTHDSSADSRSAKSLSTPNESEGQASERTVPKQQAHAQLPTRSLSPKGAPSYPTSSKTGPKNWDKLAESDGEEEEEKQDVDHFFKKLYSTATEEQRRAMMKSFVESNGTTLSTDWNDVGNRTVSTVPPEGVEEKKW